MFGAQSTLCKEDNCRVEAFGSGLGSITSCCQLALDFVRRQIQALEKPELCWYVEVLQTQFGEISVGIDCGVYVSILLSGGAPFNCSSKFMLLRGRSGLASVVKRK